MSRWVRDSSHHLHSSFNPFRLIGVGLSIWTFVAAGCGCAINFWMITISRMLVGVGGASFISPAAPFINDNDLVSQQKILDSKDEFEGMPYNFCNKRLFNDCESVQEKNQSNLVSSLAKKAMSVVGPVVPTKSDGEVDHKRLVAILVELGQ